MDSRNLSPNELSLIRKKAVESIVLHGLSRQQASVIFGLSRVSIWRYMKEYQNAKERSFEYKKRGVKIGTGSKINKSQLDQLVSDILSHTPDELGLEYTLWTSKVVHEYIISNYGINYNRRSVITLA